MEQGGGSAPPAEAVRRGVSKSLFAATVVVIAIVAFAAGLGAGNFLFGGKQAAKQYLVVGTNIPFAPFEDFNTSSGQYEGFDIDIAMLFAAATGRTLVVQNYFDFKVLLTTIGQGGVDMGTSAITMSGTAGAARNQTLSFSDVYYAANQAVLAKTSSTLACASSICTANDLKTLIVGVQSGTTSEGWVNDNLKQLMADPTKQIKTFVGVDTEIASLTAGSIDIVIIDVGPAKKFAAASNGALKLVGQIITEELYGYAVQKGDPQGLLPVINSVLAQAKANGTFQQLLTKWTL